MVSINKENSHTLSVGVDARMELLAIVQFLSNYNSRFSLLTQFDFSYKAEIENAFQSFRDHLAIRLFDQLSLGRFNFHTPPAAMLYLSVPPGLEVKIPYPDNLIETIGGMDQLCFFLSALRSFAQESHFMDFYQSRSAFFETIVNGSDAHFSLATDQIVLETYFGMKQLTFHVILVPLFHDGGFGVRIHRKNDLSDIYSIIGPSGISPQRQLTFGDHANLRYLVWHEFSHSFVNPLTEKYLRDVNQYQSLYQPLDKGMVKLAYGNWPGLVSELIVRAITIRLATRELGEEAGQICLNEERQRGFSYIQLLVDRLEHYESQRDRYPAFKDYYLELIKAFAEVEL